MKKYLKQHWFEYVFALLLIIIISIIVNFKFGYVYSTNDDTMLKNIINGNFTGTPDSHMIFIAFPLATVWKLLYSVFSDVSWYDFFMVGLHYLCYFLIVVRLGQQVEAKNNKAIIMLSATLLLGLVDLKYLIMPQFTIISAQLASISLLWMFTGKTQTRFECWLDYSVIVSTLLLSAMYRREPFLLSLPILCLAILYRIWKNSSCKKKIVKNIVVCIGVLFILYLLISIVDNLAYSSPTWSEFSRSQEARVQIYDYSGVPQYDDNQKEYESLCISHADWLAIDYYNCEFADDFDAEKMEGVSRMSLRIWNNASSLLSIIKRSIFSFSVNLFENSIQPIGLILVVVYCIVFLLCYYANDKKTLIIILSILLFNIIVSVFLIGRGRFPERVLYGMLFNQLVCLMAIGSDYAEQIYEGLRKKKEWLSVTLIVCVLAVGFSSIYTWQMVKSEQTALLENAEDWEYINNYFQFNPDNRYCIDTKSFVFSTEKLFSEDVESENMIRLGGWILNSPLQEQRMQNQGVENLVQQVAEDEHFYIVQEESKGTEWINIIWNEKGYDVEAIVVDIIETPNGRTFEVIQMQ